MNAILEVLQDHIFATILILILSVFIIWIILKIRRYFKISNQLRSFKEQRKEEYNGLLVLTKIEDKRKRNNNSYDALKRSAKKIVKEYFTYKANELSQIMKSLYGKTFRKPSNQLIIFIRDNTSILSQSTIESKKHEFNILANEYKCLDELIIFLHNLPESLVKQENYEMFFDHETSISYICIEKKK